MIYLNLTGNLTDEETMLRAKYAKLKRKKKALNDLKAPKVEPEVLSKPQKRVISAKDATEVAKKLVRSGVISAPQPSRQLEKTYKRPRGLERKLNAMENTELSYKPFCASQEKTAEDSVRSRPQSKFFYQPFVRSESSHDQSEALKAVDKSMDVCGHEIEGDINPGFVSPNPTVNLIEDTTSSAMWTSVAAHYSARSGYKDPRQMKTYLNNEDECLF